MSVILLVTVFGCFLCIIGLHILLRYKLVLSAISGALEQLGLLFVSSTIPLLFGLVMILSPNVMGKSHHLLSTIISWTLLCSSLVVLFTPDLFRRVLYFLLAKSYRLKLVGALFSIIGAILLFGVHHSPKLFM